MVFNFVFTGLDLLAFQHLPANYEAFHLSNMVYLTLEMLWSTHFHEGSILASTIAVFN